MGVLEFVGDSWVNLAHGNVILACARFDGAGFLVVGENDTTVHCEIGTVLFVVEVVRVVEEEMEVVAVMELAEGDVDFHWHFCCSFGFRFFLRRNLGCRKYWAFCYVCWYRLCYRGWYENWC